ncbi:uncharacterized protein TRIADDRAFT_27062 [Trichoplax adhaerens]|uniref:JmjC domain-containing protein n=1 Tax=Trichoplax adhaerens TaxID=10228 RepID=B3RZK9_TRIAD|nr:hypothetical protein TRIADDRAFT_27062 [Trichoplax adhaerens]EDV23857.1 hypothetical protein TRIADDRAFT_27062 [Trichoplax adhaerens]|eukprot:XP_002113383.1 hypothetical protein TRIADDRAFT_27062 [Trichoplax adhaerens]
MTTVLVAVILSNAPYCQGDNDDHPRGHFDRLGSHIDSDGHVEIYDEIPTAQKFWEKHVRHRLPAVFRGAAKNFEAFNLWTDDYLRKNYGDLEVKLEAKAEKKNVPIGTKGKGRDTIADFLDSYVKKDSYIVSQLPDPMSPEIGVLPCITCGSFKNRILEANLWLSSGGTKSLLHKDADNAINCLLNGTKDWLLIHPKYEKFIPMAKEAKSEVGGFSTINVDKVNIKKYPNFKKVHYNHANLSPGDCLYLPYAYLHQVRSYGSKNMAVSVLLAAGLTHEKTFNNEDCESKDYKVFPKLTEVNMVWTYPGHGPQTLGSMDPMELR